MSYLQLAHNEWDAATGTTRPQALRSFGREDQLDRAAIERLVASLAKLLDPAATLRATSGSELTFLASRPIGGAHALDGLWHRIGIDDYEPPPGGLRLPQLDLEDRQHLPSRTVQLLQQSHYRRHPTPPRERQRNTSSLPPKHRPHA